MAPVSPILDPTVWLDGARPANTCIPPSFPWIRHKIIPTNACQGGQGGDLGHAYWMALEGKNCSLIQGKEGRMQVLAGLAPSSQAVGSNIGDQGATFGGS